MSEPPPRRGVLAPVRAIVTLLLLTGLWLLAAVPGRAQLLRKKKPSRAAAARPVSRAFTRADSLVLRARALLAQRQEAAALELCRLALRDNPEQYEALWRASVLCSRVGARFSDETRQQQYYDEARDHAAWALEIHPKFATANFAMALAIAGSATLAPLRGRLAARLEEKPYLDAALRDEPGHADAWQLLARWHFKVANYTIFEALASRLLLGSVPQDATNAKAFEAIQRAIDLNPEQVSYYYDQVRMYLLKRHRAAAIQALVEARERATLVTTEDLAVSRQMERILQQLGRRQHLRAPDLEPR